MKVGLLFDDKRLEYRVMKVLMDSDVPFTIINDTIDFGGVILSDLERDNVITVKDSDTALRKVIPLKYGKKKFGKVIVGIDPGPKPGLAVLGDGKIVEKHHLEFVELVKGMVDKIRRGYEPEKFIVRVGDGDIVNRNRIVNSLVEDYYVELVDERNTSTSITDRDVESAVNIAHAHGTVVRHRLNTAITIGYLKEIQRRSRIESEGLITIPLNLARRVALGELSLESAIAITRRNI